MAIMGKPVSQQANSLNNVQMAPRYNRTIDPNDFSNRTKAASDREQERLINKIQGYTKKNDLIVDGAEHNKMGKDEFLKLLTVQLANQDPTSPMKQEKMAAELAQFSQLEQLTNLNNKFDGLTKNQQVQDKFYGASFLGKEVVTSGSSLKFEGEGSAADILFSLPKPADKLLVRVFDRSNNMVGEMWKENIGRGNQSVTWDGMQLDNTISAKGEFTTQVYAWDKFADPISVKTKSTGTVESVFFENGETVLKVDGKKVFLRDVDSFHGGHNQKAANQNQFMGPQQPSMNPINSQASRNQVKPNHTMVSPFGASTSPATSAMENSAANNLPIAKSMQSKVNLNAYKSHMPTTGITSVYDD